MDKEMVYIFDTTLRDGEQSPGASMYPGEKLVIAKQLSELGVDIIEAGFPASSGGDYDSVSMIARQVDGPVIAALARAKREDIEAAASALQPAIERGKGRIHTFIATSDIHVEKKLRKTKQEVIDMAVEAVKRARDYTPDVEFSPEDAARTDMDYMCDVIKAVIGAGAITVNIPDTVGYAQPAEFASRITYILKKVPNISKAVISVHCHNDLGNAVANSLAAVKAGARQVECTVNGLGERAGNAALEEIVMNLRTREDYYGNLSTNIKPSLLYRVSEQVSRITGIRPQPNKAVVGDNAFAHEAGIHQDGIEKDNRTYEIMNPGDVGWIGDRRIMGKHSGRNAFAREISALGYDVPEERIENLFAKFKRLADKEKYLHDNDIRRLLEDSGFKPKADLYYLNAIQVTTGRLPTATLVLEMDGKSIKESASGETGPVDAVYSAIDRATNLGVSLVDYTVSSKGSGRSAVGEARVVIKDDGKEYFGRGASSDIIEASAIAYLNAINRMLTTKVLNR